MNDTLNCGWPGAIISTCGRYRYVLTRILTDRLPNLERLVLWVMLNPSSATSEQDDNTIRAIKRISAAWGFDGLMVGNLYGLRSRDPAALWTADDPFGMQNMMHVRRMAGMASLIVAAWGAHAKREHADIMTGSLATFGDVYCLGRNKNGSPKHPLFIRSDVERIMFAPKRRPA